MGRRNDRGLGAPASPGCIATPRAASARPAPSPHDVRRSESANRQEQQVLAGSWHDASQGEITFHDFVEREWLPHKHLEVTTRSSYVSYLNKQFYPAFGTKKLNKISPSVIQDWVTKAHDEGLSPRSIKKYHVFLSSIFRRAVRDRILVYNPCDHTELPKVIARKSRTLTPDEFERLVAAVPAQYRLMLETFIETGMRWGELIALRPRHIDFLRRTVTRRGDDRRDVEGQLPHRRTIHREALPEEQRTADLRRPPGLARRGRRAHQRPTASAATTCSSPPRSAPRSPATASAPTSGSRPSRPAVSTSPSASTTSVTRTHPGCSPAARI